MRRLRTLLEGVLTQPTAPFRESWTKRACLTFCGELDLPVYEDKIGNLWVGARNAREARAASLVFVAHLDHPGIVVQEFSQKGSRIFARGLWLGGGPMDIRNFPVKVFSDVNALMVFDGTVLRHTKGPRGAKDVWMELKPSPLARAAATPRGLRALGPWGACLWYTRAGVPAGVTFRGDSLVTKAADDLAGACALLEGLKRAGRKRRGAIALLTRAEESGFHGTLEVLERRMLDPKRTLMISVETSAELPGAIAGNGPVVRLGDRASVFDPALVHWVQERAGELAARDKSFRFQRRVMDGGTCEATPFNAFGFHVAGLSTPLKNYHNIAHGSRDSTPKPEAVSLSDVERLAQLAAHLIASPRPSADPRRLRAAAFGDLMNRLRANQRAHRKYF
jgi:endoglucanase